MESQTTCCHKLSGELRGPAPLNPNLHPGGWQGPGLLHIQQVARLTLQGRPRPHPQNLQGTRCPPWDTAPAPQSLAPHGHWGSSWEASRYSLQPSGGKRSSQPSRAQFCPLFFLFLGAASVQQGPLAWAPCKPSLYLFCWSFRAGRAESSWVWAPGSDRARFGHRFITHHIVPLGLLGSPPYLPSGSHASFNCSSIAMWLCLPWLHFSSLLFPIGRSPQSWPVVPPPRPAHFILSDTSSPSFTQAESL